MTVPTSMDVAARLCIARNVAAHRTRRVYELVPSVLLEHDDASLDRVAAICNEPTVYETLFAERLGGRPYSEEDADSFLSWADVGWAIGTHFVYLLIDESARIAGAIDIKSPTLESGEIGYWLSADDSGLMTNSVLTLCDIARDAGFRGLHALVRPHNERSARVLERAGFDRTDDVERDGHRYHCYHRRLS
jgi:RimJ/RimL family protein N-acetyltransferase